MEKKSLDKKHIPEAKTQSTNAMHIETEPDACKMQVVLNLNPFEEQQSHTISIGGI
jgi:hypothetical protein